MRSKSAQPRASDVVADRIREGRKRKGWSQRQLAEAMTEAGWPIDRTTIAKIESGGARALNLSLNEALAFAIVLGMSPTYLIVPWDDGTRWNDRTRVQITAKYSLAAEDFKWWVSGEMYQMPAPRRGMSEEELAALRRLRADWRFFHFMRPAPKESEKR